MKLLKFIGLVAFLGLAMAETTSDAEAVTEAAVLDPSCDKVHNVYMSPITLDSTKCGYRSKIRNYLHARILAYLKPKIQKCNSVPGDPQAFS